MNNKTSHIDSKREWQIFQACEHDLPFLKEIELSAARIFPPGILPDPDETLPECVLRKATRLGRIFVCRNGAGRPIGFALWQGRGRFALLAEIAVLHEYGRQGIGTALVERVVADAAKDGFQLLFLTTFVNLDWNAPFYRKLGFMVPDEADLPAFVRRILADEMKSGMKNRVAMCLMM